MIDGIEAVKQQMNSIDSLVILVSTKECMLNKETADTVEKLVATIKASIAGYHSLQCAVASEKNIKARERIKKQAVEFMELFMDKEG